MESTDTKKECGAFVVLTNGKRYLFDESATWEWQKPFQDFPPMLQVSEQGKLALEVPYQHVRCVGGHSWFFKDAWWGQEKKAEA